MLKSVVAQLVKYWRPNLIIPLPMVVLAAGLGASNGLVYGAQYKIIELFTSHGCSSCPPADQLLGELIEKDTSVIALEYHVDYWNSLVHGSDGSFTDPFSKPEYSLRQRAYNRSALAGRPGVYTPQAIINGRVAVVGTNRRYITRALAEPITSPIGISISNSLQSTDQLKINVYGPARALDSLESTDIMLVRYLDKVVTEVTGGENRHKQLTNRHVVTDVVRLGELSADGNMTFTASQPGDGEGCAVIVQNGAQNLVHAVAACP